MDSPPVVRAATADDADAIAQIYAPIVRDTAISFEETPPDADEFVRRMLTRPRLPWLLAESSGPDRSVLGYAYGSQHRSRASYRWSVDCSVYVNTGARGHGVGRVLYSMLFDELRALAYVSLFAGVTQPNPASTRLHQALGFRPVGTYERTGHKHGHWHDVTWWQLDLRAAPASPVEPHEWGGALAARPGAGQGTTEN